MRQDSDIQSSNSAHLQKASEYDRLRARHIIDHTPPELAWRHIHSLRKSRDFFKAASIDLRGNFSDYPCTTNQAQYAQCQGTKQTQEDHGGILLFPMIDQPLDEFAMTAILNETVSLLDQKVRDLPFKYITSDHGGYLPHESNGSTLNLAFRFQRRVYVANIGDSRTLLVFRNRTTQKWHLKTLSWDHKPTDKSEKTRVAKAGGTISSGRLRDRTNDCGLAMTRSLGDTLFPGISHEPDITWVDLDFTQNDTHFIVTACDGLFDAFNSEEILQFFSQCPEKKFPYLASMLCYHAWQIGNSVQYCDNITLLITPIVEDEQPSLTFIADGHGPFSNHTNDSVSECIAANLPNCISFALQSQLSEPVPINNPPVIDTAELEYLKYIIHCDLASYCDSYWLAPQKEALAREISEHLSKQHNIYEILTWLQNRLQRSRELTGEIGASLFRTSRLTALLTSAYMRFYNWLNHTPYPWLPNRNLEMLANSAISEIRRSTVPLTPDDAQQILRCLTDHGYVTPELPIYIKGFSSANIDHMAQEVHQRCGSPVFVLFYEPQDAGPVTWSCAILQAERNSHRDSDYININYYTSHIETQHLATEQLYQHIESAYEKQHWGIPVIHIRSKELSAHFLYDGWSSGYRAFFKLLHSLQSATMPLILQQADGTTISLPGKEPALNDIKHYLLVLRFPALFSLTAQMTFPEQLSPSPIQEESEEIPIAEPHPSLALRPLEGERLSSPMRISV